MPLHKIISINETTTAYFWHITEDVTSLFRAVSLKDTSLFRLEEMKSEAHQKGFLAVRMLLQDLGYTDFNLHYDATGKPHLKQEEGSGKWEEGRGKWEEGGGKREEKPNFNLPSSLFPLPASINKHISISHSHEFSCICISDEAIGIDMEIVKEKTLKIAPRFLDISHLEQLSQEEKIKKATVIWGIKESIFKVKNEIGISFQDHIFEEDFNLIDAKCTAQLRFNNQIEKYQIQFYNVEEYIFVCAIPK
jgi:phosphopantetheinyl transferase